MRYLRRAWWSAVIGIDAFAMLLTLTLLTGHYSVMYWLWDTAYGVWYLAIGSAIVGISFGTSTRNHKISRFVKIRIPQGLAGGRYFKTIVPALHLPVKGFKRG